jgi:hypothetical protein
MKMGLNMTEIRRKTVLRLDTLICISVLTGFVCATLSTRIFLHTNVKHTASDGES